MQLFAGELTNQNREYYKVNDDNYYTKLNTAMRNISSKYFYLTYKIG